MTIHSRDRGRTNIWLSVVLATPVYLLLLALALVGVWMLWPGSNWVLKVLGVICLLIAWTLRPRPSRAGEHGSVAERYVQGAIRTLLRWEELMAPYRPKFDISPEHQVILVASGRRDTISRQAESGLVADVVSLLLWPFRMMARVYRGLIERALLGRGD